MEIVYMHHPLYSSASHGPADELREVVELLFVRYGVDVIFAGHEHVYERLQSQRGIQYFVSGNAAKLRAGDVDPVGNTAAALDGGYSFVAIEIAGRQLYFQSISATGQIVDSGTLAHTDSHPRRIEAESDR